MLVRDIMSIKYPYVLEGSSVFEVCKLFTISRLSTVMVIDTDRRLKGTITEELIVKTLIPGSKQYKEFSIREGISLFEENIHQITKLSIESMMEPHPLIIHPRDNILKATLLMANNLIRLLPVVEHGKLQAVVTRSDICWGWINGSE